MSDREFFSHRTAHLAMLGGLDFSELCHCSAFQLRTFLFLLVLFFCYAYTFFPAGFQGRCAQRQYLTAGCIPFFSLCYRFS